MDTKRIAIDDNKTTPPVVMHGDVTAAVCLQDARNDGVYGIKHRHNEAQISMVTSGVVKFVMQDDEYEIKEGGALFINCNRFHEAYPVGKGECTYLCLKFNPAIVGGTGYGLNERYVEPLTRASAKEAIVLSPQVTAQIVSAAYEIDRLIEEKPFAYEISVNIEVSRIWLAVCSCVAEVPAQGGNASFSEKMRIETLRDYIHQNYAEKISLNDIAGAAHISKGECCRIFKRMYHMTPFQYLVQYRLNRSIEFLTDTDYSIAQIAQHVGFCSSSYYTKCFRKEYNCVPHKYRQDLLLFDDKIS